MKTVKIGNQILIHADMHECLASVGRFDLLLTDPPYGLGKKLLGGAGGGIVKKAAHGWDKEAANKRSLEAIRNLCTDAIIWGGNYFELPPSRAFLIWDKGPSMKGRSFAECEIAWVSKDMNARIATIAPTGKQEPPKIHPTQKPLQVMKWCLSFFPSAKTVFDPYMGSGTTLIACQDTGRHGTGIEMDEEYFQMACDRLSDHMRQRILY